MRKAVKIFGAISAVVVMLSGLYAFIWSRFVPSENTQLLALVLASACGFGGGYLAFLPPPPNHPRPRWLGGLWIRLPIYAALSFSVGYQALAAGLPGIVTSAIGIPGTRIVTVESWRFHSRYQCSGPDIYEAEWLSTICLRYSESAKAPAGSKLLLSGASTSLGIVAEHVSVLAQ
jgi:hypothetical protein